MSKQPKHIKPPYHVVRHSVILGESGFEFHQYGQGKSDVWDANAEFLCRAVNSHDALLAACKSAKESLNLLLQNCPDPILAGMIEGFFIGVMPQLNAAIAQAEPAEGSDVSE